jgi:hypothetical protein
LGAPEPKEGLLVARALLLACGVLTALIVAAPLGARTDGKDKVNGTIQWFDQTIVMDAQSGPSGEDARGTFSFIAPTLSFSGPVTALIVDGNKATACGTITASSHPLYMGLTFQQYVRNTGDGSSDGTGDTSATLFLATSDCPSPAALESQFPNVGVVNHAGNWQVTDSTP